MNKKKIKNNRKKTSTKKTACSKFLPLGDKEVLTWDDIAELVEHLVNTNANKFKFDIFDKEDIAQIIRMKCWSILPKWVAGKSLGNPVWYFGTSVQNHLRNLHRDFQIKNPTYNPKDKTVKPIQTISEDSVLTEDSDFMLANEEIMDSLSKSAKQSYVKISNSMSTKGVSKKHLIEIRKIMMKVLGYSIIDEYGVINFDLSE